MDNLFLLLFLVSILCIVVGLIKPKLVIKWGSEEKKTRKNVLLCYGVSMLVCFILFGITMPDDSNSVSQTSVSSNVNASNETSQEDHKVDKETPVEAVEAVEEEKVQEDIPTEYRSALTKAEMYNPMSMSKAGLYDQLVSEYGEKFTKEAAQYAIDNVEADWKENALKKAKIYQKDMSMSSSAIYDQLMSEHGEKFTKEEAQYAIDNLE